MIAYLVARSQASTHKEAWKEAKWYQKFARDNHIDFIVNANRKWDIGMGTKLLVIHTVVSMMYTARSKVTVK